MKIIVDDETYELAQLQARKEGKTVDEFVAELILKRCVE